jgi:hypothetical protein
MEIMEDDLLVVRTKGVMGVSVLMTEIMTTRFKRISEVTKCECPMKVKDCFLCEHKYPYKVHKAYKKWVGDPVCKAVERKEGQ